LVAGSEEARPSGGNHRHAVGLLGVFLLPIAVAAFVVLLTMAVGGGELAIAVASWVLASCASGTVVWCLIVPGTRERRERIALWAVLLFSQLALAWFYALAVAVIGLRMTCGNDC
jgi:hypothetical protein